MSPRSQAFLLGMRLRIVRANAFGCLQSPDAALTKSASSNGTCLQSVSISIGLESFSRAEKQRERFLSVEKTGTFYFGASHRGTLDAADLLA